MEDLQRKVRDYETRGVQATLDMQRAARAVALENSRLRALLSSKGVSDYEVEKFLASSGEGSKAQQREVNSHCCGSEGSPTASDTPGQDTPSSQASANGAATDTGDAMCLKRLVNDDGPHPFRSLEPWPAARATQALTTGPRAQSQEQESNASTRTTLPPLHSLSPSPHEMSCSAAAEIIAGAHGHGDECVARSVLGCADSSNCVIKNTQVLQVLQNS